VRGGVVGDEWQSACIPRRLRSPRRRGRTHARLAHPRELADL